MYKVKLSIAKDNKDCQRQTPSGLAIWGKYKFFINQEIESPDFWAFYSKGEKKTETCTIAPENTLFITGEPETVYHYANGFVNQFNKIVVCQKNFKHDNQVHYQPGLPWHLGKIQNANGDVSFSRGYDDFKNETPPIKTKLISVISSNKAFTKGHQERIDFVLKLKEHFGDKIDLFGKGFNDFDDKWDVIAPYKYHVVIENSAYPDYWSEKLSDSYLANTYPIYYGCTNLEKYFEQDAYSKIDINDFEGSVRIIENILEKETYENSLAQIQKAKDLVLDKYNLFALLASQFDTMSPNATKKQMTIKHDTAFIDFAKIRIMIVSRIINTIKMKFK